MKNFLRENGLSVLFFGLFVGAVAGHSFAGQHAFNAEQLQHGEATYGWIRYVLSSHFGEALMENWESEFLQFSTFIMATVYLMQRGSPESKKREELGSEDDKSELTGRYATKDSPAWARLRGFRGRLYDNSLMIVMTSIFLLAMLAHSLTGWNEYNAEQLAHGGGSVPWATFLRSSQFWEQSLQNWQSEFLAVGTMVVFSIYLRQRGSKESKKVGAPHEETGS
jgi:hypothetical protein